MPLQDLTPQLRTRLSRLESLVGWFVLLAALLMLAGFSYYVHHTAQRKGWFMEKVLFSTFVNSASGIKAGDPVLLMGFPVGEIVQVTPNEPNFLYGNVTVFFEVRRDANNYCGYLWSDSKVKIAAADFLGNRRLELVKGQKGIPIFRMEEPASDPRSQILGKIDMPEFKKTTNLIARILIEDKLWTEPLAVEITNVLYQMHTDPAAAGVSTFVDSLESEVALVVQSLYRAGPRRFYKDYQKGKDVFIDQDESPALTERLERVAAQVEKALPNILGFTNQLARTLNNAVRITDDFGGLLTDARPAVADAARLVAELEESAKALRSVITNLETITTMLREPKGSLGEWLIPTNLNQELELTLEQAKATMATANQAIAHADTNLATVVDNLNRSLDSLAGITSNLNWQVQANTNILSNVSDLVRDADTFVQGLRRHWLLRSAFKTNAPPKPRSGSLRDLVPQYPPPKF